MRQGARNDEPRRILHLIDSWGPGGAETVFTELVGRLSPERWTSLAVVPREGWVAKTLRKNGIQPILIPVRGSFNVRYLRGLIGAIREFDIDLVHAHLFGASTYGGLAGRMCGVPVVSTLHGEPDLPSDDWKRRLRYALIRRGSRRMVLVSASLRKRFHATGSYPRERSTVIHNGIDLDIFGPGDGTGFRQELGVGKDHLLIGAVGNFRSAKAFDVFVEAAGRLAPKDVRFRFVIVGQHDRTILPALKRRQAELGLGDRIMFPGFCSEIPDVFRALDVFVCSSWSEGFSLATVQAMASGVPVVATRSGGPEEIILHGRDGVLVAPGSPDEIADAVMRLVTEPAWSSQLVEGAKERATEAFSIDRMIADYESLYEEVLR